MPKQRRAPRGEYQQVSDPRVLRAIAHPVRNRILAELSAVGPLRAADVAAQIDVPANQASFHLRQLAKYGIVEEAPELARDGRDRVWRMVNERGLTLSLDTLEDSPGGKAAVAVFRREAAAQAHDLVESAFARRKEKGVHVMTSDHALRLTEEESKQFGAELGDLVEEWRSRTSGGDDPDRRTYRLLMVLLPFDLPEHA
jgi:DNA-binding transcriptional ArsR family regulator